jgi:hypothetical protein
MGTIAALLALVLSLIVSPTLANGSVAPLPIDVSHSKARAVEGLYVEQSVGAPTVEAELTKFEADCRTRNVEPNVAGRDLLNAGRERLYRQATRYIVYIEKPHFEPDTSTCAGRITVKSVWHGRKLVEGNAIDFYPSSADSKTGEAEPDDDDDTKHKLGWPDEFVGGDQPNCKKDRSAGIFNCSRATVAGLRAICFNLGDSFQGSHICLSRQKDSSFGLWLSSESYLDYDDGSGERRWTIDIVVPSAKIDTAVFKPLR